MFGAWGNADHDDCVAIIHAALDAGINFVDTADVYAAGESEEIVGKALVGRRDEIVLATKVHGTMGEDPNQRGNSRRWIVRECEASLRRLGTDYIDLYQIHRPDPDTDIDETLGALSDLVHAGQGPLPRELDVPAVGDRGGAVDGRAEGPRAVRLRAAAVLDPRARDRGRRAADLRALRHGRDPVEPARRWLAVGQVAPRRGAERAGDPRSSRTVAISQPENQRKLDAADALGQLAGRPGDPLVHLAVAWVIQHPTVTAAIIGPRTMEQLTSQLGAADDVTLDAETLDRIDEIVPPGTNFSWADAGYLPPATGRLPAPPDRELRCGGATPPARRRPALPHRQGARPALELQPRPDCDVTGFMPANAINALPTRISRWRPDDRPRRPDPDPGGGPRSLRPPRRARHLHPQILTAAGLKNPSRSVTSARRPSWWTIWWASSSGARASAPAPDRGGETIERADGRE